MAREHSNLIRVRYMVYPTRKEALAAGWPDAEYGTWQVSASSVFCREGWIALDRFDYTLGGLQ